MEAGRELDALVAEKVMGLTPVEWSGWEGDLSLVYGDQETGGIVPRYSTDIGAAWEVVEKLKQDRTVHLWSVPSGYMVQMTGVNAKMLEVIGQADTAPLAICRAALSSVGVEVVFA